MAISMPSYEVTLIVSVSFTGLAAYTIGKLRGTIESMRWKSKTEFLERECGVLLQKNELLQLKSIELTKSHMFPANSTAKVDYEQTVKNPAFWENLKKAECYCQTHNISGKISDIIMSENKE